MYHAQRWLSSWCHTTKISSVYPKIFSDNFLQITPSFIHTANLVGLLFIIILLYLFLQFWWCHKHKYSIVCLILPTAPSRSQSPRFPTPRRSARTQEARMRQRRRLLIWQPWNLPHTVHYVARLSVSSAPSSAPAYSVVVVGALGGVIISQGAVGGGGTSETPTEACSF